MAQTKTKRKTKKKETETSILNVVLVWDMSGSMNRVRSSAIEGANEYIRNLQGDKRSEQMRFSLIIFDTVFESWFTDQPVSMIPVIGDRYQPRGFTALNDAVALAISNMDERVSGDRKDERVLIVVLTDGMENASREYGGPGGTKALAELVKSREEKGWTFVYLGAGEPEEVILTAATYNIPAGNAAAYAATPAGTKRTFAHVSNVTLTRSASSTSGTSTAFEDAGIDNSDVIED